MPQDALVCLKAFVAFAWLTEIVGYSLKSLAFHDFWCIIDSSVSERRKPKHLKGNDIMATQITQEVVRQALDEFVGSVILSTTNGPERIFETKEVLFGFGISDEELNDLIACLMFNITSRNLTPFNDRMNEIVNRF